jgi:hypothetical protein
MCRDMTDRTYIQLGQCDDKMSQLCATATFFKPRHKPAQTTAALAKQPACSDRKILLILKVKPPNSSMDPLGSVQKLDELKQLLQDTREACNENIDHIIEEQNERNWRASEKVAKWEDMRGQVEKIKANIKERREQESEKTIGKITEKGRVPALIQFYQMYPAFWKYSSRTIKSALVLLLVFLKVCS